MTHRRKHSVSTFDFEFLLSVLKILQRLSFVAEDLEINPILLVRGIALSYKGDKNFALENFLRSEVKLCLLH